MSRRPCVFISYAHADGRALSDSLYRDLEDRGYAPWRDTEALHPSDNWMLVLRKAINFCDVFLALISQNSVRDRSVCLGELAIAHEKNKPIIPVLVHHDVEVPVLIAEKQYIDFSSHSAYSDCRNRLFKAIERVVGSPDPLPCEDDLAIAGPAPQLHPQSYSQSDEPFEASGANFPKADFTRRKDLVGADFRRAFLREANFEGVNLAHADFTGAVLVDASILKANLDATNLQNANCRFLKFSSARQIVTRTLGWETACWTQEDKAVLLKALADS